MEINVGGLDRVARIAIGAVLVLLALTGTISVWGYLGLIPLADWILQGMSSLQFAGYQNLSDEQR